MIKGLIFDLDGTITTPGLIDFGAMRAAIGCPNDKDILEFLTRLRCDDPSAWARACAEVRRREEAAMTRARPAHNFGQLRVWLHERGYPRAIFTRNARATALRTLSILGLENFFEPVIAREDAPPKPAPDGVRLIAEMWGMSRDEVMVIGDYRHDIEAGNAAGVLTVQIAPDDSFAGHAQPNFVVGDLLALTVLVDALNQTGER